MRVEVDAWVAAGLLLQRGAPTSADLVARAQPWIAAAVEAIALLPPLGVIADLGRLLTRAPFDIARSEAVDDPALREALDAYEEHLLGRVAADYRLELARDALVRLDAAQRPAAIAVFVEQVLARVARHMRAPLDSPGPAAVRRVLHTHAGELIELGAAALAGSDPAHEQLRAGLAQTYAALARGARQCSALIGAVELSTLENHEALRSPAQRLALAQISEAAEAVERALPVRVRRSAASRGRTPTRVEDESAYPIGGYASISTLGGIESLVSSELIYMNPPAERARGEVDLFDLRWAGGELLKYTRDESVHTRERRTISFVLKPELDDARLKDPELPWQRIVIAFGGLVAGVRKLATWLDEAELHLRFVLFGRARGRQREQPLAGDAALSKLILREHIESGVVEIVELADEDAARAQAEAAAESGASDLVWVSSEPWAGPREPDRTRELGVREHALSLADAHPRLWIDGERGIEERTLQAAGWEAWLRAFAELFEALV